MPRLIPARALRTSAVLIFCCGLLLATAHAQTFGVLHNFTGGIDGSNPFAGLTVDAGGHLYGTSGAGEQDPVPPNPHPPPLSGVGPHK